MIVYLKKETRNRRGYKIMNGIAKESFCSLFLIIQETWGKQKLPTFLGSERNETMKLKGSRFKANKMKLFLHNKLWN